MTDFTFISSPGDMSTFSFETAFKLLNFHVAKKSDSDKAPSVEHLGYVAGMVHINEEVEVILKFMDRVEQLTKFQFYQQMIVIDDD